MIAQPLVVKHKLPDFVWKLLTLPLAFPAAGLFTLSFRRCGLHGPDRIGRRAQLMRCHVSHCYSLPSRVGRKLCRAGHISGGGIGDKSSLVGLAHFNLASCPGVSQLDRLARPLIFGSCFFKEMQDMLRACGSPYCKKVVICITQGAATTNGNKPGIARLNEDRHI